MTAAQFTFYFLFLRRWRMAIFEGRLDIHAKVSGRLGFCENRCRETAVNLAFYFGAWPFYVHTDTCPRKIARRFIPERRKVDQEL